MNTGGLVKEMVPIFKGDAPPMLDQYGEDVDVYIGKVPCDY